MRSFDWIEPPVFDGGGRPRQHRGVATDAPGLFFLGEEFMFAAASATLPGSCRDARYLAGRIPAAASLGTQRLVPQPPGHALRQPPGDHAVEDQHGKRRTTIPTRFSSS